MGNLAYTFHCQRRYNDAEELQVQVLEASRRLLGPEHPDTLRATVNPALTLDDLGRWKDADVLSAQVTDVSYRC
jgi:hypothetical protein